jgi:hypothetical protein
MGALALIFTFSSSLAITNVISNAFISTVIPFSTAAR